MYYINVRAKKWKMNIFPWKFVHDFNSYYTRHNSRLYELLLEFCDAAWNQIYNSYLIFVYVTRLMIRVGIKNSLASHVLYFMWILFFKNLVKKKRHVGMCLIQKNLMKMKMVYRLVSSNMTMLKITFKIAQKIFSIQTVNIWYDFHSVNTYQWQFLEVRPFDDRLDKVKTYSIFCGVYVRV